MSRSVRIVLLCEDRQHETFATRFLREAGWERRSFRVERAPTGRGSAEQYVRERFPAELQAVRAKRGEQAYLFVMVDGDAQGAAGRMASLAASCEERRITPPNDADQLLVCVPTWNIETWLAYLGGETVDETRSGYPRLDRPRDCGPLVKELAKMCRDRSLRAPYPPSLQDTCTRYQRLFGGI